MRVCKYHIIHCSDSPDTLDIGVKEIDRWHRNRGWKGCGYHFVIRRDGTIECGRMINRDGAHCYGYNKNSIGTCLIGRHHFTPAQFKSLKKVHKMAKSLYPSIQAKGHKEFNKKKTCPNFEVSEILQS